MRSMRIMTCLLFLAMGLLAVPLCSQAAQSTEPVKIGTIVDLTGPVAFMGQMIQNGLKLRLDEAG